MAMSQPSNPGSTGPLNTNLVTEMGPPAPTGSPGWKVPLPKRDKSRRAKRHSLRKDASVRSILKNIELSSPRTSVADSTTSSESSISSLSVGSLSRRPSLRPASVPLGEVDFLCYLVKLYMNTSFASNLWPRDPHQKVPRAQSLMQNCDCAALNNFYSSFISAQRLLERNPTDPTGHSLIGNGLDHVRRILTDQHYNFLLQLFSIIFRFKSTAFDVLRPTLDLIAEMAQILLGSNHPLAQITLAIKRLDHKNLGNGISCAWKTLAESFDEHLGYAHCVSLNCHLRRIESIFVKDSTLDTAEGYLKELLFKSIESRGELDLESVSIRYSLAKLSLKQGEAEKCCSQLREIVQNCDWIRENGGLGTQVLRASVFEQMAAALYQLGQQDAAGQYLRDCVGSRAEQFGHENLLLLNPLLSLEELSSSYRNQVDTRLIHDQRLQIIAKMQNS